MRNCSTLRVVVGEKRVGCKIVPMTLSSRLCICLSAAPTTTTCGNVAALPRASSPNSLSGRQNTFEFSPLIVLIEDRHV